MILANAPLRTPMRVTRFAQVGPITYRLMELGLIEGSEVEVVRRAPLGDPLQLRLGDSELSLRSRDAAMVEVAAVA